MKSVMQSYDKGARKWKYSYLLVMSGMEGMALVFPMLLQIVTQIISESIDGTSSANPMGEMFLWGGVVLAFIIGMIVINIVAELILAKYGNGVAKNYRGALFNKFQRVSSETVERFGKSKVVPYVLNDSSWIRLFKRRFIHAIVYVPFTIFGSIGMLFFLGWEYALIALGVIPIIAVFYWINYRQMRNITKVSTDAIDDFFLNVKEGITGARDIRILGKAKERAEEFEKLSRVKGLQGKQTDSRVAFSNSFMMVLFTLVTIAIIIFGINVNMKVAQDLVVLNTVLQYVVRMQAGSQQLFVWFGEVLPKYVLTKERMNEVLSLPEVDDQHGLKVIPNLAEPRLEFSNVECKKYNATGKGLNLNLTVPFNNRIAIAGGMGSKKNNIWKILLREEEVTSGHIAVNGIDISSVNRTVLRRQMFSYCDPSASFVNGTIRDNMKILSPNVTDEEILQVFTEMGADDFAAKFHGGLLDYQIDTRKPLSDGTRNILNLVRCVLKPASVYIFNQCFDHIPNDYLTKFMAMLKKRRMTCLLITYNSVVCKACNKVFVLKQGKIIGEGKHAELLAKNAEYQRFYASTIGQIMKQDDQPKLQEENTMETVPNAVAGEVML